MAADRDIGVALVRAWAAGDPGDRRGWEATAATGVRGLRLVGETGAFRAFRFSEANRSAAAVLAQNVRGRPGLVAVDEDARHPSDPGPFEYVDVDPYGSPLEFLAPAVAAVRDGGLLGVTATDMIVLAGAQPSATERRYGARPVRGRLGPEGGVRILLAALHRVAVASGRRIEPRLAYTLDHHVRAYVTISAGGPDDAPVGSIDATSWTGPALGGPGPFGPLWLGPLSDPALVRRMEVPATAERPREVGAFLARLAEESEIAAPFYYEPNVLAGSLGLPRPPSVGGLIAGLVGAGYRASRTHARPEGVRTDAPRTVVEAVVRRLSAAG